jgi:hypothetical protein
MTLFLKPSGNKLLSCPVFRKLKLEVTAIVDGINNSPDALMDPCDRDAMDESNVIGTAFHKCASGQSNPASRSLGWECVPPQKIL